MAKSDTIEVDVKTITDLCTMVGEIKSDVKNLRETNTSIRETEKSCKSGMESRISVIEVKQERFAWYVGVAVGLGMVIMFVLDRVINWIANIKN